MLLSWGARPPYCSGLSPRATLGRGPRAAPARWCGLALRPRPPREQAAGGAWARGVRVQLRPPPTSRSLLGEAGRPLGSGGAGGRRFCGAQAGGAAGVGGEAGLLHRSSCPCPIGYWPGILCLWRAPPGYTRAVGVARQPWASGAARSAASGSVRLGRGREGGSDLVALFRAPAFPRSTSESPCRGRWVAGNAGACGRFTGGAWRAATLAAAAVYLPLGAAASPWGCGAAVSPVGLRPLLGRRGGGEGRALWYPDAAPRRPRGGGLAVLAQGGQPSAGGAHSSPAPLHPVRAGPSCRPSLGPPAPPAVVARRWLAGSGREGQWSAVSGLPGSGLPLALVVPALPPTGGGVRLSVALYRGEGVGRGARLSRGWRPAALSPPHSLAPVVWAVTYVAACVGGGTAAVAAPTPLPRAACGDTYPPPHWEPAWDRSRP